MLISNHNRQRPRTRPLHLAFALSCAIAVPRSVHTQSSALPAASKAPRTSNADKHETFDHRPFDDLLHRYVIKGFVDYDAFAHAPQFSLYLASLAQVKLDAMNEDERLAFWINAYNAFTIQLIVSHHETESIRNVNRTLGVLRLKGPWSEPLVHAAGRTLSLDDVQHTILRKEFAEPRTHFALACGAIGCPPLRSEAYTGEKLVDQLNDQGVEFLRKSPTKNHIDTSPVNVALREPRVDGRPDARPDGRERPQLRFLYVSPVLMAYRNDFGPARNDLARALAPWFEGTDRTLLEKGRVVVVESTFDWTLNSQAQAKARHLM